MKQDYVIAGLLLLVWITGMVLIFYRIKGNKVNEKVALEHIDKYHDLKKFLINYQTQVRMFSVCKEMHDKIGEWSFEFVDRQFMYSIDDHYLCIYYVGERYALGLVPDDFPFERIAEKKWK